MGTGKGQCCSLSRKGGDSRDILLADKRLSSLQGLGGEQWCTASHHRLLPLPLHTPCSKKAAESGETCRVSLHTHLLGHRGMFSSHGPRGGQGGASSAPQRQQRSLGMLTSRMGLQKDLKMQLGLCLLFPILVGLGQTLSWISPARRE